MPRVLSASHPSRPKGKRSLTNTKNRALWNAKRLVLALAAHQALFLGHGHGAALHQLVKADDLRPDEAPLKVRVDFAGGLGGLGSSFNGPGANLRLAGGEVGDVL